ncbi:HxlR family transcriptional regulator [Actinomadura pelletieri DSM 43383]|uniref:HxlR family transcriptional regulator n=1 Tax=Actinomadura pelletieri DSM 43383 TaxID=1120940 RepID=A0A495R005_9ACTN|nr:helix-turn-helix domain-containing protein [Actinomadura pelletieri]RKS79813.1 HxlR family transcriptional regulator [Actinomadura pelletieri DSM 43383]
MGDAFHVDCPARAVLDHVTSRWATLILTGLRDGPLRFSELRAKIEGISEKMLSQTLRTLVEDGLIARTVHPSTPPAVSYRLTELGNGLTHLLHGLMTWIGEHADEVQAARTTYRESASLTPQ